MEIYKLQWRRSVLVVFCSYAILVSAFANGYIPATINQIETRFSLTATQIAGYGVMYDVALVLFSTHIGYYGTKYPRGIPLGLFTGMLMLTLGEVIFGITLLAFPAGDQGAVGILILANFFVGLGAAPIYILGPVWLARNLVPTKFVFYSGWLFAMVGIGPAVGFGIGGALLNNGLAETGFFIFAGITGLFSIVLLCVPTSLPHLPGITLGEDEQDVYKETSFFANFAVVQQAKRAAAEFANEVDGEKKEEVEKDTEQPQTEEDVDVSLKATLWRLAKSPTYILLVLTAAIKSIMIAILALFAVRFVIFQFNLSDSDAAVYLGVVTIAGTFLGVFIGSCVLKCLKPTAETSVKIIILGQLVGLVTSWFAYVSDLILFLVLLTVFASSTFLGIVPASNLIVRIVRREDEAVAFGVFQVFDRLIGSIPGPLVFGALLDNICITFGNGCELYDEDAFRALFCGAVVLVELIVLLLAVIIYRRIAV